MKLPWRVMSLWWTGDGRVPEVDLRKSRPLWNPRVPCPAAEVDRSRRGLVRCRSAIPDWSASSYSAIRRQTCSFCSMRREAVRAVYLLSNLLFIRVLTVKRHSQVYDCRNKLLHLTQVKCYFCQLRYLWLTWTLFLQMNDMILRSAFCGDNPILLLV